MILSAPLKHAIFYDLMNISSKVNSILDFSFSDMTSTYHIPLPLGCTPMVEPSHALEILSPHWKARQSTTSIPQWLDSHVQWGYWTSIAKLGRVHLPKKHFNIGEKVKPTETPISRSSSREALSNSFYLTREKMKLPFFCPDHQICPQACIMNEQLGASSKSVLSGN